MAIAISRSQSYILNHHTLTSAISRSQRYILNYHKIASAIHLEARATNWFIIIKRGYVSYPVLQTESSHKKTFYISYPELQNDSYIQPVLYFIFIIIWATNWFTISTNWFIIERHCSAQNYDFNFNHYATASAVSHMS